MIIQMQKRLFPWDCLEDQPVLATIKQLLEKGEAPRFLGLNIWKQQIGPDGKETKPEPLYQYDEKEEKVMARSEGLDNFFRRMRIDDENPKQLRRFGAQVPHWDLESLRLETAGEQFFLERLFGRLVMGINLFDKASIALLNLGIGRVLRCRHIEPLVALVEQ